MTDFDQQLRGILDEHLPDYNEGGAGSEYIFNSMVAAIKQLFLDLIGEDDNQMFDALDPNAVFLANLTLGANQLRAELRKKIGGK